MPQPRSSPVGVGRAAQGPVTRSPTPRLRVYGALSVVGLLAGLALGRPELVALAAPLIIGLSVGLLGSRHLNVSMSVESENRRALEGDQVDLVVTLTGDQPISGLIVEPHFPAGLHLSRVEVDERGAPATIERGTVSIPIAAGQPRQIRYVIECQRWGGYRTIDFRLAAADFVGLYEYTARHPHDLALRVYPRAEELRRLLTPLDTHLSVGDLQSRVRGSGHEFSELRPFDVGDDMRRVNWRASARRDRLWINEYHPDHNGDIVLLVDTPSGNRMLEAAALDYTVRAVATLAREHLGRRDRVGLIVFGGVLRWLRPTTHTDQRYQILDALADSRIRGGELTVTALPRRALPPHALVIGLSPLVDADVIGAFVELRGRGVDLALIEVTTDTLLPEPKSEERQLARRIWELERDQIRRTFRKKGVAVARWNPEHPFTRTLEEVYAFRKAATRR